MNPTYEVIARKWRPQQFADVVGQQHVVRTLSNAIESGRLAHAYLFVGPRGTGKTTTARIISKALNCERGPTITPCDQCDNCREIMAGNCMDVLEIDGASNNSVDQVRELRQNVQYSPARCRFKIYIIDEVHMLSNSAFNALLKTLEEPPKHVKFMFATTEAQKIPATILSRCQRFDLRKIAIGEMVERLQLIAEKEGVDIDPPALLAIARGADGGMRDAQSALDQIISFQGRKVTEADVLSVFGLVSWQKIQELAVAVLQGDMPAVIRVIAELDASGKDMQRLMLELIEYIRNLLVLVYTRDGSALDNVTEVQLQSLKAQVDQADAGRLLQIVQILTETEGRLRYAISKRTLMETALLRAARVASVASIDQILRKINELKSALAEGGWTPSPGSTEKKTAEPASVAAPHTDSAPEPSASHPPRPVSSAPATSASPTSPAARAPAPPAASAEHERSLLWQSWRSILERLGHVSPPIRNALIDAKPKEVLEDRVVIGFDPEFSDNMTRMNNARVHRIVQKVLGEVLRREVAVSFAVLDASDTLPGDIKYVAGAGEGGASAQARPESEIRAVREGKRTREDWLAEPIVRQALEVFNGDIEEIRE